MEIYGSDAFLFLLQSTKLVEEICVKFNGFRFAGFGRRREFAFATQL